MANEEIIASEDNFLDETAATTNRGAIDHLNYVGTGASERNPIFKFDVSGMSGKSWDSVVLRLTYWGNGIDPSSGAATIIYLSYVLETDVDVDDCSWEHKVEDAGQVDWTGADGAEDSTSNDHTTRIVWPLSGAHSTGDVVQSANITALINQAIDDNSGILNLIMYGTGNNTLTQQFRSLESTGVPESTFPTLVFANVQATASASATVTDTSLTTAESASLSSQSNRPPVSEPARQAVVSILHDGVEPMNILALIIKAEYGTDA